MGEPIFKWPQMGAFGCPPGKYWDSGIPGPKIDGVRSAEIEMLRATLLGAGYGASVMALI